MNFRLLPQELEWDGEHKMQNDPNPDVSKSLTVSGAFRSCTPGVAQLSIVITSELTLQGDSLTLPILTQSLSLRLRKSGTMAQCMILRRTVVSHAKCCRLSVMVYVGSMPSHAAQSA